MAGTRYVRYIVFTILCLTLIFFFSSSSAPTSTSVSQGVKTAKEAFREKWKGQIPDDQKPAILPKPGGKTPEEVKQDIKDEMTKITPPEVDSGAGRGTSPNNKLGLKGPLAPGPRMNATFVSLARNSDVWEIAESIRQVEDRFNHKFNYNWVFLNDDEFDDHFKKVTTKLVSGTTEYGLISEDHWSFPSWIDQEKAAEVRKKMAEEKVIYGDSISYRHMCRFESGFFFRQPLMNKYEWYWRVEPSIKLYCDVDYDVFKFMADNKKKYSFVLSLFEYVETIPTLWDSVRKFIGQHPEHIAKDNSMDFLSDNGGKDYNHCHFWSNFEVGNLDWLRSKAYIDFFNYLDKEGGFFYERWGDAPVHSIAAGLLLQKDEIHFFDDIGYWHVPFTHCPNDEDSHHENRCHCNPDDNFDWNGYSCTAKWYELHGLDHPEVH